MKHVTKHMPLVGGIFAGCLFAFASTLYPGGTAGSPDTLGYSWAHNTFSALFQPLALNGEYNSARYWAAVAAVIYCTCLGFVFAKIARSAASAIHRNLIQIAGIGAMIYAALVVTPMHNLMVLIALVFFVVAVAATLHSLYTQRRLRLMAVGLICVSLPLFNAAMYYSEIFYGGLPVVQKLGTLACGTWLFAIYYGESSTNASRNAEIK
jgi:hypothetical protein